MSEKSDSKAGDDEVMRVIYAKAALGLDPREIPCASP